jgi:hypothetical protein
LAEGRKLSLVEALAIAETITHPETIATALHGSTLPADSSMGRGVAPDR